MRIKVNQKGIVWIPIIVWSIIISGTVLIAQDAVKKGYITPSPQPTSFPTLLPTYRPTSIPTKKPSQGQVQGVTTNNQNPTTTQGRSGHIVKYKEYCQGGKEISVYENELITRKALSDGKTYSMTKEDWNCSDRDSITTKQPTSYQPSVNQGTTPSKPTITCVMPYGTFQVPQVHCDNAKAILRDQESIKKNFNENMERIRQESDRKLEEITSRTFESSYISPTFPTPAPLRIEVEPEPCVVVPPGFGGATSGRVNEAGFPCAN